jgi:hypothetical protein
LALGAYLHALEFFTSISLAEIGTLPALLRKFTSRLCNLLSRNSHQRSPPDLPVRRKPGEEFESGRTLRNLSYFVDLLLVSGSPILESFECELEQQSLAI